MKRYWLSIIALTLSITAQAQLDTPPAGWHLLVPMPPPFSTNVFGFSARIHVDTQAPAYQFTIRNPVTGETFLSEHLPLSSSDQTGEELNLVVKVYRTLSDPDCLVVRVFKLDGPLVPRWEQPLEISIWAPGSTVSFYKTGTGSTARVYRESDDFPGPRKLWGKGYRDVYWLGVPDIP